MGRHTAPPRGARYDDGYGDGYDAPKKRKTPWIIAGAVVATALIGGGIFIATSDNSSLTLRQTTVAQGDKIDTDDGKQCVIGVTDVTRAWTSESCVKPGEEVSVGGRVIGVGGDVTANGLASIELHRFVTARNDFDNVTVTPAPKDGGNFDGIEVCATGAEGTIYGCEVVEATGEYVSTVNGFYGVPAGTPVWVRSTVSDSDSASAQLLGLVAVPGEGQDKPALVSLIPVVGEDGSVMANTAGADVVGGTSGAAGVTAVPDEPPAGESVGESNAADAPVADEGTPDEFDGTEGAGEGAGA